MKIALYIEDGLEQIVLTPETDTERAIVGKLHDADRQLSVYRGEFYSCQGGWVRHARQYRTLPGLDRHSEDDSTILVLHPTKETSNG